MSFNLDAFGAIQAKASALPPRRKPPKHRHATPSGPWPFLDIDDEVDSTQLSSPPPQPKFDDEEERENYGPVFDSRPYWSHYPQSQFANWTQWQQNKSGIARVVNRRLPLPEDCRIFKLDIWSDGIFRADNVRSEEGDYVVKSGRVGSREVAESIEKFWQVLGEKPRSEARIKVFFVDNLSGPVLQMLGTKYRIEPFFFSSSLNSIPSRYQEQVRPGKGDHVTLTLSFIRTLPSPATAPPTPDTSYTENVYNEDTLHMLQSSILMQTPIIDVEAPLVLTSNPSKLLVLDLISLHVIRRKFVPEGLPAVDSDKTLNGEAAYPFDRQESHDSTSGMNSYGGISTIISYHLPSIPPFNTTSASTLHKRLLAAGRSVYWSHIFQSTVPSGDPTFVTLSLLWYPLYAWDEVLEVLLGEVAFLEAHTLSTLPSDGQDEDAHEQTHVLTHQLHVIRAHLLHYESLLDDFRKTVEFFLKTVNPGLVQPTSPFSSPSHVTPLPSQDLRSSSTQNPSTATASQYPAPLRSALPVGPGEAPSLAAAVKDTFEHVLQDEEEGGQSTYSRPPSDSNAPQPSVSDHPNIRVSVDEPPEIESYERLLKKECTNLLNEIDRLEMTRAMLNNRLGNVMELAFSSVNIEDSRRMKNLAEVSVRDSAVMKQISYLTMIFLPASFVAAIFGMNVIEINPDSYGTVPHYLAAAIPLTFLTVWVMMMQYHATKQRSRAVTPSNLLNFVRVAPSSVWRKFWTVMWWPLRVFLAELAPRRSSRNRSRRSSWLAPSPGTSLRTRAAPSRPRSNVHMPDVVGEPLTVARPAPSSLYEVDVEVGK
ncbi:hypothetical protein C8J55DRAFT_518737 [Lentinula edodes]|uniref:Cora-domain-containing protein n=1 Tax=Lentinula lateritia TaxID=40482 RepID=A0A9W9A5F5_9AGAR|nr:hypothetical protein C8J55DRAFT_518737 [Lentinula edodes]